MFALALKMTLRDWRAGQLRFLLIALTVAVAALSATGFFIDRLRAGLDRDARQLIGADVVINADLPVNPAWRAEAQRRGLVLADVVSFVSMAQVGEGEQSRSVLAALKAVAPGYPCAAICAPAPICWPRSRQGEMTQDVPAAGTVWLDPALLGSLSTRVGEQLKLGERSFTITRLIAAEPDRAPTSWPSLRASCWHWTTCRPPI
jgi:putative ABC transport system permease protein